MDANKLSSISKADSLEKMGEFWDTHDFTDFDNPDAPDTALTYYLTHPAPRLINVVIPLATDFYRRKSFCG